MLKQPTTFGPFMGKLIAFALIAMRTSQYDKVTIMARETFSAAYRNRMIKMVDIRSIGTPFKRVEAIITSIFLDFQLILNLLGRECAWDIAAERASSLHLESSSYAIHFRPLLSILLSLLKNGLPIILIALSILYKSLFLASLIVPLVILLKFFGVCLSIAFAVLFYTRFTLRSQVSSLFILIEKFRRSREYASTRAFASLLRGKRGIIHSLNSPLLSHLSFSVARMVGVPLLSQWLITPLLGNMSIIPFFIAA